MSQDILKLLAFRVSGRHAHFRKFYTNSSSLSYLLPPRTAIMGMLASVLEYERDDYYAAFDPKTFKIGASVTPGTRIKKKIQSLNYLHSDYYTLLNKASGKGANMHSQCKLELLIPDGRQVDYSLYLGATAPESLEILNELESRIKQSDFGYGVYLGQRQFRAEFHHLQSYFQDQVRFLESAEYTDTLFVQESGAPDMKDERNLNAHLVVDQMPIHMQKESPGGKKKPGRVMQSIKRVVYEKTGQRIYGTFQNGYGIAEKIITFFEG